MPEFTRIETSRGPVTSEDAAEMYLIRTAARIHARDTLEMLDAGSDEEDRGKLAAALGEARGMNESDILADLEPDISALAGAYIATYRNSGARAATRDVPSASVQQQPSAGTARPRKALPPATPKGGR